MIILYYWISALIVFYSAYFAFTLVSGFFFRAGRTGSLSLQAKPYVILIPAFRPTKQLEAVLSRLRKEVDPEKVRIYVLLQDSEMAMESMARSYANWVDHKSFQSLKGNPYHHALNFAVSRINSYCASTGFAAESVLLLDPDNSIDQRSLSILNHYRNIGADVVQSRRIAISKGMGISTADALSERINDYQLRRGKQVLGLLPEISGSGIMFERSLFERAVQNLDKRAPGMDKNLLIQMLMLKADLNLIYTEEAVVSDEKTEKKDAYGRQRTRWFANQYFNAFFYAVKLVLHSLKHGNLKGLDYLLTLLRPPRSIQLALVNVVAPLELIMWLSGLLPLPAMLISAVFMNVPLLLMLLKEHNERPLAAVVVNLFSALRLNLISFLRSLNPKLLGTFIHTRNA